MTEKNLRKKRPANNVIHDSKAVSSTKRSTLEELVAGITPENRHEEIDWGPDVGAEIVEWDDEP